MTEKKIRKMILESGYKQWEVAEQVGVHPNTLCCWVRSRATLTAERELRIVRALEQLEKMRSENGTTRKAV